MPPFPRSVLLFVSLAPFSCQSQAEDVDSGPSDTGLSDTVVSDAVVSDAGVSDAETNDANDPRDAPTDDAEPDAQARDASPRAPGSPSHWALETISVEMPDGFDGRFYLRYWGTFTYDNAEQRILFLEGYNTCFEVDGSKVWAFSPRTGGSGWVNVASFDVESGS